MDLLLNSSEKYGVDVMLSRLVFGKYLIQISAGLPVVFTVVFHDLPQSLQMNVLVHV
jgi:hypothetical protein